VSYDVFLWRYREGEAVNVDAAEVWQILERAWVSPPDESDHCRVRRDADEGDLYAVPVGAPIDSLMFNHAGEGIYNLMFDLAVAGDMTIIPIDAGPFIVRAEQREHLPLELRDEAIVVSSGAELLKAIEEA
jgi:hypothetical protein